MPITVDKYAEPDDQCVVCRRDTPRDGRRAPEGCANPTSRFLQAEAPCP